MEEAALFGVRAAAGSAVEKNYRLASGIATFLEIDFMNWRDPKFARVVRFNRRIEPVNRIFHDGCGLGLVGHKWAVYRLGFRLRL
jgi:hypothetical protein